MTDRELRRLSRSALIELLIEQTEINEELRSRLAKLEKRLKSKTIAVSTAGSMADAALELNNVFSSADKAAQQYLDNLREATRQSDAIVEQARQQAEQILADAYAEADRVRGAPAQRLPARQAEEKRTASRERFRAKAPAPKKPPVEKKKDPVPAEDTSRRPRAERTASADDLFDSAFHQMRKNNRMR